MTRPLALIEGELALPSARPLGVLPPPFGLVPPAPSAMRGREPQPRAPTAAQQAILNAMRRQASPPHRGPASPNAKFFFFYKLPKRRDNSHKIEEQLAEARYYLEAGKARPNSTRSDHLIGGAIFVACSIALAWLLATCTTHDDSKGTGAVSATATATAVRSPLASTGGGKTAARPQDSTTKPLQQPVPIVDKSARRAPSAVNPAAKTVDATKTTSAAPKAADATRTTSTAPKAADAARTTGTAPKAADAARTTSAAPNLADAIRTTSATPSPADATRTTTAAPKTADATSTTSAKPKTAHADTPSPHHADRLALRPDARMSAHEAPFTRMSKPQIDDRLALSRAVQPAVRPSASKQAEWAARSSSAIDAAERAALLDWAVQQRRASMTTRASTPVSGHNDWNTRITQRRITDNPDAFDTGRAGK